MYQVKAEVVEQIVAFADYLDYLKSLEMVVAGNIEGDALSIQLWLMSCRVLKRGMEDAMMNELVKQAKKQGIKTIRGYYYPTAQNAMVKDFFVTEGFTRIEETEGRNVDEL